MRFYALLFLSLILPISSPVPAAVDGPIAHYTFDEGSGDTVLDLSGNGNNGRIHGATFVPSPRGHALKFDGVKSFVDLGTNPAFNISGDMSFEAWVKVDPGDRGDKFIFGDSASLAVNRNFYISANNMRLRMEYGNSSAAGQLISDKEVFTGEWQHIALVCEFPYYHMYVDGREVTFGEMTLPITRTEITPRRIGGWWWERGYFKGEIDEIRVYDRAIQESMILRNAGLTTGNAADIQNVSTTLYYGRHRLDVKVLCKNIKPKRDILNLTITNRDGKYVLRRTVPLTETRPGTERSVALVSMESKSLQPGEYNVQTRIASGPVKTATFTYPQRPEWFESQVGNSDKVLAPFTPLEVENKGGTVNVYTWGRAYEFGDGLFIAGVSSQNKSLLTGPARLIGRVDGRDLVLSPTTPAIKNSDVKATLSRACKGNGLDVSVTAEVEYDGLVKFDWKVRGAESVNLESLVLEIPYDAGCVKYLYSWKGTSYQTGNGALKENEYNWEFRPMIWLGNDDVGMQWVAESDKDWYPESASKAVQIVRQENEVILRLNLVRQPVRLAAGQELAYTFGLQATPVKPMERDAWDYRFNHVSQNTHIPADQGIRLPDSVLDDLKAKGVRTLCIHEHWTPVQGYTKTPHEADLADLVKRVHDRGMKILLYFGFNTSDLMPEWPHVGEECVVYPKSGYIPYDYPPQPLQNAYITCLNSPYQDLLADGIARLVDEFDIDGVYLDTTVAPFACTNHLHGCGYRKPDGSLSATYPVFAVRSMLKRMYTVIRERKPDGMVDAHVFDAMNMPALAFATSIFNGEQLHKQPFFPDGLPLDRFRAEFMGVQWGVPVEVMEYMLGGGYKGMLAISLLHDIPCRIAGLGENLDLESKLWRVHDDFGREEAKWFPYYLNSEYVSVSGPDCHVSFHQHPVNGILAVVSNLGRKDAEIDVSFHLPGLGLEDVTAEDALLGTPLGISNGKIQLSLPSTQWTIIRLRLR